MNAIQPIHRATPHSVSPVATSSRPAEAEPSHPFAQAMRSAVTPEQTAQRGFDSSGAPSTSRPQSNRSKTTTAENSKRAEQAVSAPSSQTTQGDPATLAINLDGQNDIPLENASSTSDGKTALLVGGQWQFSIVVTAGEDQSSGVMSQRLRTPSATTDSSPSERHRKQTSAVKSANASAPTSGSSQGAVSISVASVTAIMPNIPGVKLPSAAPIGSTGATASSFGPKPIDPHGLVKDSALSNSVNEAGAAAPILHADESAAAVANVQPGGISAEEIAALQHTVAAHGVQESNGKPDVHSGAAEPANATATSPVSQNSRLVEGSKGSQPASRADGTSATAFTDGISKSAARVNTSTGVNATGDGNSAAAAADPVRSSADRAATSIHGGASSKTSSFSAAMSPAATTPKDVSDLHTSHADSGIGLQNSSSLFSSGSHIGAGGSFSSAPASSTTVRATAADAFAALDSGAPGERGVLLHAAPHQVAVGVSDPSLGWVEVRAERVSGQIAAALTTNSAASHAALTSVLPTMAMYLQEHQAGVHQVHVDFSLAGRHAGTGSQGQASSQNQSRTAPDNFSVANASTTSWDAAPVGSAAVAAGQRNNAIYEGHHFSIRA